MIDPSIGHEGSTADRFLPLRQYWRAGFSLIEVTLALLVVALGLLAIFHLFPAGLQASANATADTRTGQFADEVLTAWRVDLLKQNNWAAYPLNSPVAISAGTVNPNPAGYTEMQYPQGSGEFIQYRMRVENEGNDFRKATLELKYGRLAAVANTFYSEAYRYPTPD